MSARLAPFLQASAFAFRSFPLLFRLPLAFAPLGNKRHHHRPLPCVDRTIGERNLTTPRGLLAQLVELTTHCSDCATAHAFCSSRSPLARPLPCVDRTIGARNLLTPRGLPAQLVELATHCSDRANLSHHILPPRPGA